MVRFFHLLLRWLALLEEYSPCTLLLQFALQCEEGGIELYILWLEEFWQEQSEYSNLGWKAMSPVRVLSLLTGYLSKTFPQILRYLSYCWLRFLHLCHQPHRGLFNVSKPLTSLCPPVVP